MRKRIVMALLLLANVISLCAQNAVGLPAKNAIPNIIPPTPEAYALGRFGGNTIGLSTGTVIYSVPLYTIKAGNISIPLSVSYASNGVKVDEIASNTRSDASSAYYTAIGWTAVHETLHQFGLGDRYKQKWEGGIRKTTPDEGFKNDIMGMYLAKGFSQIHLNNIGNRVLELQKAKSSNNFILDVKVDNASNLK